MKFASGKVYSYENVDDELVEKLKEAPSKGSFLSAEVFKQTKEHPYRGESVVSSSEGFAEITIDDGGE